MSPLKILFNYCQQHHQFQYRMPLHTVHIIRRIIRPNIVHNSHRRQRLHHQPLCRQPVPLSNSTMRKIHRPMTVLHQMHIKVLRPKSRRPVPVNLAVWWVISVRNRMIWKVKYFGLILSVLGSHTKKSYFFGSEFPVFFVWRVLWFSFLTQSFNSFDKMELVFFLISRIEFTTKSKR